MRLIDNSYFEHHPFFIDGIVETYIIDTVNDIIDFYEPIICKKLIGDTLYQELLVGLAETTPLVKWTDLKALLVKASQAYCYLNYVKQNQTNTLQTGEATQQNGNLQKVSPFQKLQFLNDVIADVQIEIDDLCSDSSDYENYEYESIIRKVNGFGF